jgi:hypothetical protein
MFLRGCRTYITEIEGEEAPKSFLWGCRACVFQCGCVDVWLQHHHFASNHHIISHNITSYRINDTRIEYGANFRQMLHQNEKVLRHEVSFGNYSFVSLDTNRGSLFAKHGYLFFFTKHGPFSLRSMKRRKGVFSPKAKKRYVCKFHASQRNKLQ